MPTTTKTTQKSGPLPFLPHSVESWPIGKLKPYAANAKQHSAGQVRQLARSMAEFGWTVPVLVASDGEVIAGHGRLLAAEKIGATEIPVIIADHLTEDQRRAYRIADNRLTELGEWDFALLGEELKTLLEADFDTSLTGFADLDVANFISGLAGDRDDEDDVPDPPAKAITKPGDLWQLGPHRLICGDATNPENAKTLLAGDSPDLILTDPPYCSGGFQEANKASGSVGTSAPHRKVVNDTLSTRGYMALLKAAFSNLGAPYLYCFTDWRMWVHLFDIAESSGYGVRSMIVWDKGTPGMGRGWRSQHELVMWATKQVAPFDKHAPGQGNVIGNQRTGNIHHTTEKPVELLRGLLNNTPFAKTIADPFLGSGTTIIAAAGTERVCLGLEIDPVYCDVIVERWQNFSNEKAKRINGR